MVIAGAIKYLFFFTTPAISAMVDASIINASKEANFAIKTR